MSIGLPFLRLQELGLPLIRPRKIFIEREIDNDDKKKGNDNLGDIYRLIAHSLISTIIFLVIIIWFTLILSSATQNQTDSDYFLLHFSVYFTVIAVFVVVFIILSIT